MKRLALSLVVLLSTLAGAQAAFVNLEAQWSGADFGNGASATATFSLDLDQVANPGFSAFTGPTLTSSFQNFNITVAGASAGNGSYDLTTLASFFISTSGGTLDLNTNWVGQSTPFGAWGFAGPSSIGDFNFFSNGSNLLAPTGVSSFTLRTSGGEMIRLVSLAPAAPAAPVAVPETSTWVMGILAVGFVAFSCFRSRLARQTATL